MYQTTQNADIDESHLPWKFFISPWKIDTW